MNMSNAVWGWNQLAGVTEKCDHRSTCFAKVVGLRKFCRLSDRPRGERRAVNRPNLAIIAGAAGQR